MNLIKRKLCALKITVYLDLQRRVPSLIKEMPQERAMATQYAKTLAPADTLK